MSHGDFTSIVVDYIFRTQNIQKCTIQYDNNAKKKINRMMIQMKKKYYEVMYISGSSNLCQYGIVYNSKILVDIIAFLFKLQNVHIKFAYSCM